MNCQAVTAMIISMKRHEWLTYGSRFTAVRGERHYSARLTAEQALHIKRNPTGKTCRQLAELYGVHVSTVKNIWSGRNWSHVA